MATGRGLRPARVSFLTSPNADHHSRLADKSLLSFIQRKKRLDSSPSKTSTSSAKENPDEVIFMLFKYMLLLTLIVSII